MAEQKQGLRVFDAVLLVGGAILAVIVAFWVLHFVVGLLWLVVKVAVVVGLIALFGWWLLRDRD